MLPDWKDLGYLQHGSAPQRQAFEVLRRHELLPRLRRYDPVLVGTFPLDLTVPGSDLDIICEVPDWTDFRQALAGFAGHLGYVVRSVNTAEPALAASFLVEGLAVEVFGQAQPTARQNGYRHLVVEARLLAVGGAALRQQVLALKASGLKTEPAFAQVLGLPGNPYHALLALETWDDAALASVVEGSQR
ncbi:DUF4269 domain-containing protein [Hymenobacter cheonanensis]|uniref:DUF4269 domain-containing protein n=1 Tax=Hymenobacter sp. CA2-7 TaxID=3063993 RepID=UPI002712FCC7|nr:DUF4269 domain-containing protein [Hymenobacter sp. CA2-7]MDO7887265.1 DUF4269 domain-containing protein [Hymenobacter sp. CA2-7]